MSGCIDLFEYEWDTHPPHDKWVKVLCAHDELNYVTAIARLGMSPSYGDRGWTFAPGYDVWGPVVAWRDLYEGERP